jgi:hypothetical protein
MKRASLLLAIIGISCSAVASEEPLQVSIETHFVLFEIEAIAKLASKGEVTLKDLQKLREDGKTKLLCAPLRTQTLSGQQVTVKAVSEYIYPTDFTVIPVVFDAGDGTNALQRQRFEPSGFETREVGCLLEALPEVRGDGMIMLAMTPQVVYEAEPHVYKGKIFEGEREVAEVDLSQPTFRVFSTTASVIAHDGETLFFGSLDDTSKKNALYVFVTVRIVKKAEKK